MWKVTDVSTPSSFFLSIICTFNFPQSNTFRIWAKSWTTLSTQSSSKLSPFYNTNWNKSIATSEPGSWFASGTSFSSVYDNIHFVLHYIICNRIDARHRLRFLPHLKQVFHSRLGITIDVNVCIKVFRQSERFSTHFKQTMHWEDSLAAPKRTFCASSGFLTI